MGKGSAIKRSLIKKCEEEFNKHRDYMDIKLELKQYGNEEALDSAENIRRRYIIGKKVLGNIKFIGQLFKKGLLKEKIMRYCISTLMKLDIKVNRGNNLECVDNGDMNIHEEDHEAICSMFTTVGQTIDTLPGAATFTKVCFDKIARLSEDRVIPTRSRFMYKDLLELRQNRWVPSRKEEYTPSILICEMIRENIEREERRQAQLSQQAQMEAKPSSTETDADGFTTMFRISRSGHGDGAPMRDIVVICYPKEGRTCSGIDATTTMI